jgi:hypothetical protein
MRARSGFSPCLLLVCVFTLTSLCLAQEPRQLQPGTNVNVLPGYGSASVTDPLRGDGYLQRQVEPAVAASSRNPDHLLAAFGDFRVVDLATGSPPANATEAWIGLSRSYNRGRTWFGSMVPGFPGDTSVAGRKSPINGLGAGGDPGLAVGTNGYFYLSGVFFNRGGLSTIAVIKYQDIPDNDGGDNIRYLDTFVVDKGSVAATGNFDDKPAIVADIPRKASNADACGGVYIAYTIFTGNRQGGGFNSKLGFSRSKEGKCGGGWDPPSYLNKTYAQNQGAAIAVDPRNGKIYVIWRHFTSPDALLMVTSSDYGATFSNPAVITQSPEFLPYDQFDNSTDDGPATFRTNAFPTVAVDGDGNVFVAVQEKVGPGGSPRIVIRTLKSGQKSWTSGSVVEAGLDENTHQVLPALSFGGGQLRLMWYDFRPSIQGLDGIGKSEALGEKGYISGMGRLMNVRLAEFPGVGEIAEFTSNGYPKFRPSVLVSQYFIEVNSGHIPKVASSKVPGMPAINRANLPMYNGGKYAFISDYIGLIPVLRFVRPQPGDPEHAKGLPWRWAYKSEDYGARSSYGVWYDTRDVVDPADGDWTNYAPPGMGNVSCQNPGSRDGNVYLSEIKPGIVVGSPALSRQLVDDKGSPIQRAFPFYVENPNPPVAKTTNNPNGSKFLRLSIDAPNLVGSFYQFDSSKQAAYVEILPFSTVTGTIYVHCSGTSCVNRFAPFTVTAEEVPGPIIDPASGEGCIATSPSCTPILGGLVSSLTFNADPTSPDVTNTDFNQPDLRNVETHSAQVSSPVYSNPQHSNFPYANPQHSNPQHSNPQHSNPQHSNLVYAAAPVGDFTWTVTNVGNNASAYTSLTSVTDPPQGYTYELILSRLYKTPMAGENCTTAEKSQDQVISIIPEFNPQHSNPQHSNPQFGDPQHSNPQHSNATFYLTPVSAAPSSSPLNSKTLALLSTSAISPDDTVRAPLSPDEVKVTLRVFQSWPNEVPGAAPSPLCEDDNPDPGTCGPVDDFMARISQTVYPEAADTGQPAPVPASTLVITTASLPNADRDSSYSQTLTARGGAPPYSWSIISGLPAELALNGDTISGAPPISPGIYSVKVQVTDNSSPQQTNLVVLELTVTAAVTVSAYSEPESFVIPSCTYVAISVHVAYAHDNSGVQGAVVSVDAGGGSFAGLLATPVYTATGTTNADGNFATPHWHCELCASGGYTFGVSVPAFLVPESPIPPLTVGIDYGGLPATATEWLSPLSPVSISLGDSIDLAASTYYPTDPPAIVSTGVIYFVHDHDECEAAGFSDCAPSQVFGWVPTNVDGYSSLPILPMDAGHYWIYAAYPGTCIDSVSDSMGNPFILTVTPAQPPEVTGVSPSPLPGPATPDNLLTGTFVITGRNLQGGYLSTDGPFGLYPTPSVNADGTVLTQGYYIGCCAPYEGEIFNLVVHANGGTATVQDSITLPPAPPIITGVSPSPLVAPTTTGTFFQGVVTITGRNLQGGYLSQDGPVALNPNPSVNADGTVLTQGYYIGCCAAYNGQVFHFIVHAAGGTASVEDTIAQ